MTLWIFPNPTPREAVVLEAIGELRARGGAASYAALGDFVGRRSSGCTHVHVRALAEKGFLTLGRSARSIELTALGEAFLPPRLSAWCWDERGAA